MAFTSISFVFLSLFAIHQAGATWAPTKPTLALTCDVDNFDLVATYAATASSDYSQSINLNIGADATSTCAETGTSVGNTQPETVTKSDVDYGTPSSPGCGTGASFTNDVTQIEYTSPVTISIAVTKGTIERLYVYSYIIKCTLTRSTSASTGQAFTVATTAVEDAGNTPEDATFDLGVTLSFLDASTSNAQPTSFNVNNKDNLLIKISETTPSAQLKFTPQRCYASSLSTAGTSGTVADIISDSCALDESVTISDDSAGTDSVYTISTRAFSISGVADQTPYYLHCNIFVCLESEDNSVWGGKCVYGTQSCSKKRKRRSVVNLDELVRGETISSVQTFTIIDDAYTTDCPEGHVFDTLSKLCTHERVFKILGVHLDKQWDAEYANSSSAKFKWFAKNTAREIRSLILATGVERQIRGIKVIAARPGSVILDVLITYDEEVEPREAFETFKNMLYHTTPQVSRLVNVLNVIKEKTVELVPVEMGSKSSLDKNFIIVVVFAVVAVAFISAITLYQVQKLRRRQVPPVVGVAGIDNSGMEKA